MKQLLENWRRLLKESTTITVEADRKLPCPPATQDLELNTKNRDHAIKEDYIQYGPLNLSDQDYYIRASKHWNTTPEVAKESKCSNCIAFDISPRMLECLPGPVSEPIEDEDGMLGYCWMHHFKCHSARTCFTWAAGGPISKDTASEEWQEKNLEEIEEKKDDRCTRIAKRKYDVWPSAYASGAVVKCRQGKIWKGVKEEKENLESKIRKALKDEGGAAGMKALEDHTEASEEDIKRAIDNMKDVGLHADGDYILDDKKEIEINKIDEIIQEVVDDFILKEKEGLHKWFSRQGGKGKSKGWVDCNTCRKDKKTGKKTCKSCGREEGEKRAKYPSCRPTPSACGTKGKGEKWGKKK